MNGVDNTADLGGVLVRRESMTPPTLLRQKGCLQLWRKKAENYRRLGASYTSEPIGTSQKTYQEKNQITDEVAKLL